MSQSAHDLAGLMKHLARVEWKERFDDLLEVHFRDILAANGITFDDLEEIIGNDAYMTLWGCTFEDFLTMEFDTEHTNIIDDYLKRRGWKENTKKKIYMKALRTSVMSLYEVSDIIPGLSFKARDLIRGGEPILVTEHTATYALKKWDRLAARIVPTGTTHIMGGGVLIFTKDSYDELLNHFHETFDNGKTGDFSSITDESLRNVAFLFTKTWLHTLLAAMEQKPHLVLKNTDGEDIVFHNACFQFSSRTPRILQKDIVAKLDTLAILFPTGSKSWDWLDEFPEKPSKLKSFKGLTYETTDVETNKRVLGSMTLKGSSLILSVNSTKRAKKGVAIIQEVLGDLIEEPNITLHTPEQAKSFPSGSDENKNKHINPKLEVKLTHQYLDSYYSNILNQPIPLLDDMSPRDAAKTKKGRKKAAEWLKYLENRTLDHQTDNKALPTYDFNWIWTELGIEDLQV